MWLPKDERRLLAGYFTQFRDVGPGENKVFYIPDLFVLLKWGGYRACIREFNYLDLQHESTQTARHDADNNEELLRDWSKKELRSSKASACNAARQFTENQMRVERANRCLEKRGLIKVKPLSAYEPDSRCQNSISINLTLDGYDLGERYSKWFRRLMLWFQEHPLKSLIILLILILQLLKLTGLL